MHFRYARHTNDIEPLKKFYVDILGLEVLGCFENHQSYNGIFLGKKGLNWHLEFTESKEKTDHTFDEDDILVFYPESKQEIEQIEKRIKANDIPIVEAQNPYWNENGTMISDPDGHKVVISPLKLKSNG